MSIIGLSMAVLHAAPRRTWKQGAQPLRVNWPVYPRRAEHNTVAEGGNRRRAETARLPAKLSGACALYPASSGTYEPENGFRIGLRPAHRAVPIRHRVHKPDVALAPLVGFGLVGDRAQREGGGYGVEGGGRDGDADRGVYVPPRGTLMARATGKPASGGSALRPTAKRAS
jgi:hypothetical protein